jgi:cytoskeletal protein CcmA (bactofilin family)
MSCFAELTYAVYVDGELPSEQLRPLEAHLVRCRRCRELVVALREESDGLSDVLQDRVREPRPSLARRAPARGLALGLGPALAVAGSAALALGWALESLRPASLDWITPLSIRGATDMAFDLIFLLRDEAPAAFEVALAVAAMASVSALLTFALTAILRHWSGPRLLGLAALLALLAPAPSGHAHFGLHEHRDFTLPAGETHDGTLVASGRNVNVEGVVSGDLFVFGRRLDVRGEVRGNVVAIARNLEVSGVVTGSVHAAGSRVEVSGEVAGNLYALSEDFTLREGARVQRDAAFLGKNATFDGSVGRDLLAGGEWIEVRGAVARHLQAWAEGLVLRDGARIGGDVEARLPEGTDLEVAPGARVQGETRTHVREGRRERGFARWLEPRLYLWMSLHVAAGFVVGMLLHALLPGAFGGRLETAGAFFRSLGLGFVAAVAAPIALGLVALTLVGIPLALIGAALYVITLYAAGIVVSALVGSALVHPRAPGWTSFGLALLVGLLIVVLAIHLPFLGGLVRILAILTGLGLLVERARLAWSARRSAPV